MREILFRGKRIDNGEWVYGYYICKQDPLLPGIDTNVIVIFDENSMSVWNKVDPSTIGQYTGLNDKNGTKIFEGDILRVSKYRETYLSKIVFNEKTAGFEFWWRFTCGAYGEQATGMYNMAQFEDVEVIGNIHDSPELLEVKK